MIAFEVKDMTCGHCVSTITKAVKAADAAAVVDIDLAAHLVRIASNTSTAQSLGAVITEAGYTPVQVSTAAPAAPGKAGGCQCGGGGGGCGQRA